MLDAEIFYDGFNDQIGWCDNSSQVGTCSDCFDSRLDLGTRDAS